MHVPIEYETMKRIIAKLVVFRGFPSWGPLVQEQYEEYLATLTDEAGRVILARMNLSFDERPSIKQLHELVVSEHNSRPPSVFPVRRLTGDVPKARIPEEARANIEWLRKKLMSDKGSKRGSGLKGMGE